MIAEGLDERLGLHQQHGADRNVARAHHGAVRGAHFDPAGDYALPPRRGDLAVATDPQLQGRAAGDTAAEVLQGDLLGRQLQPPVEHLWIHWEVGGHIRAGLVEDGDMKTGVCHGIISSSADGRGGVAPPRPLWPRAYAAVRRGITVTWPLVSRSRTRSSCRLSLGRISSPDWARNW